MFYTSKLFSLATANNFTFRELRNFRALYVSQHLQENDTQLVKRKRKFTYTFYGNAEAISPAQRRRFRESQRTFPFLKENEQKVSLFQRKLKLFSTKRTKLVYSFSSFDSIRRLLYGTILSRQFVVFDTGTSFFKQKSNILSKNISFSEESYIANIISTRPFLENFFKYSATFRRFQKQNIDAVSKIFLYDALVIFSFANKNQRKTVFFVDTSIQKTEGLTGHIFKFMDAVFIRNSFIINLDILKKLISWPNSIKG